MRVGLTLCLVLVATVVVTLRLLGRKILVGFLSPLSAGLMTGVKVFPGRLKEIRPRGLVGLTPSTSSSSSSSSSSSEERVRSLSMSWKLLVGEMVLAELGVAMIMMRSVSKKWKRRLRRGRRAWMAWTTTIPSMRKRSLQLTTRSSGMRKRRLQLGR